MGQKSLSIQEEEEKSLVGLIATGKGSEKLKIIF
jgi:hypothetical protein